MITHEHSVFDTEQEESKIMETHESDIGEEIETLPPLHFCK
jgi:hypothetical protein